MYDRGPEFLASFGGTPRALLGEPRHHRQAGWIHAGRPRVHARTNQDSNELKGIRVLLRVGDPVGDIRCEIWTKRFRAVHAKELGKP